MATTVQQIIDAGMSYSTSNDPTTLATDLELIGMVDQLLKENFARGARINPQYYGKTSSVAFPGAGLAWAVPTDAMLVFRIEKSSVGGTKVNIVPFDDQGGALDPKVYMLGRAFYVAGGSSDPDDTADALIFWYAQGPAALAATADNLDARWPEAHNRILEVEIGIYLSKKDDRGSQDLQELMSFRDRLVAQYESEIAAFNLAETRRHGHSRRVNSPTSQ